MKLFGRAWSVQIDRTELTGLDMSFSIVKTVKSEPNTCELKLYNLSDEQRGALESTPLKAIAGVKAAKKGPKDAKAEKSKKAHQHVGIPVRVIAGYEEADSLIWNGDLRTVESTHEGTEWLTELGSGDGEAAYRKSRISQSFGPGTPIVTIIKALATALGVGVGNLNLFTAKLALSGTLQNLSAHGIVLAGSVAEQLEQWTRSVGLEWSIQNGALQFTERGQPLVGKAILLSQDTGLIGEAGIDQEGVMTAKMLMIPNVNPGSVLVLDSIGLQGNFRIEKATYEGDTSGQPWYITAACKPY